MHNKLLFFAVTSMLCLTAFNNVNAAENNANKDVIGFTISQDEYSKMGNMNKLYDYAAEKLVTCRGDPLPPGGSNESRVTTDRDFLGLREA